MHYLTSFLVSVALLTITTVPVSAQRVAVPSTRITIPSSNRLGRTDSNIKRIARFCKRVSNTLTFAASITPPASVADRYNLSIDLLTKMDALCGSMLEDLGTTLPNEE